MKSGFYCWNSGTSYQVLNETLLCVGCMVFVLQESLVWVLRFLFRLIQIVIGLECLTKATYPLFICILMFLTIFLLLVKYIV